MSIILNQHLIETLLVAKITLLIHLIHWFLCSGRPPPNQNHCSRRFMADVQRGGHPCRLLRTYRCREEENQPPSACCSPESMEVAHHHRCWSRRRRGRERESQRSPIVAAELCRCCRRRLGSSTLP